MASASGHTEAVLALTSLARRLREECPWDRAQTVETIVPHTVEEAYEVADAALAGDDPKLLDELGDLLFQTVFLALLLEERGTGDLERVARGIHAKLVRRHPHVFGVASELASSGEVKERWEELKAQQENRVGIFHDIPASLPALLQARKAQRRAATAGFDFGSAVEAFRKIEEEVGELRAELRDAPAETEPDARFRDELGDLLFACVNVARLANVDPELALRGSTGRFVARVGKAAEIAAADGVDSTRLGVAEQDEYFERAKSSLRLRSAMNSENEQGGPR